MVNSINQSEEAIRHLLTIKTPTEERTIALKAAVYSMGRDASNAIHIDSRSISRQHALLIRVPDPDMGFRYQIRDGDTDGKRSTNGVKVNGHRCEVHDLSSGDLITIGSDIQLSYHLEYTSSPPYDVTTLSYRRVKLNPTDQNGTIIQADSTHSPMAPLEISSERSPLKDKSRTLIFVGVIILIIVVAIVLWIIF